MKQLIGAVIIVLATVATAHADRSVKINNGIGGLLLGAAGGAIAGQAIGQDTESTLLGTTVGTLVGYIVGNEMDKYPSYGQAVSYRPQPVPAPAVYGPAPHRYRYEPVRHQVAPAPVCREVEILGTMHGQPQKFITYACQTPQGWQLIEPAGQPVLWQQPGGSHPGVPGYRLSTGY